MKFHPAPDDGTPTRRTAPAAATESTPAGEPTVRMSLTPAATALLARLRVQYGELMFHQSGRAGEETSPMCYPQGEFVTSETDVHLGDLVVDDLFSEFADPVLSVGSPTERRGELRLVAPSVGPADRGPTFTVPFWTSRHQARRRSAHLMVDVQPGRGSGFSVETSEGVRFVVRDVPATGGSAALAVQVL